jgi:hypothetical protein
MTLAYGQSLFFQNSFQILYQTDPFVTVFPIIHFLSSSEDQPDLIKFYMRSSLNEGLTVRCAKG